MGVQSSILPIFMPALARALRADWAPGPGVVVMMVMVVMLVSTRSLGAVAPHGPELDVQRSDA